MSDLLIQLKKSNSLGSIHPVAQTHTNCYFLLTSGIDFLEGELNVSIEGKNFTLRQLLTQYLKLRLFAMMHMYKIGSNHV